MIKVLVIEDDNIHRMLIVSLLAEYGHYTALDLLDGAQQDGCLEGSRLLMMMTHPEREWVMHAQRLGVRGFLIKPFDLELARQTIAEAIGELQSELLYDHSLAAAGHLSPQDLVRLKTHVNDTLTDQIGIRQLTELQVLFASSGFNYLCFCVKRIIQYKNRISWNRHVERKAIQDLRRHFFSCFTPFVPEKNNAECR